jgi:hypothetical protein
MPRHPRLHFQQHRILRPVNMLINPLRRLTSTALNPGSQGATDSYKGHEDVD